MLIARVSPYTGKETIMDLNITEAQIENYRSGALLQNAFPNLSAAEREFFKTGYTQADWDEMFGDYAADCEMEED